MPKKTFYLDTAKTDAIKLQWGLFWKNFSISKNDQVIGEAANAKELREGKIFKLFDGRSISVKLKRVGLGEELEILLDGKPIAGSSTDPRQQVKIAFVFLLFIGILNAVLGAVVEFANIETLKTYGINIGSCILGLVYIGLACLVKYKLSLIALYLAIILMCIDTGLALIYNAQMRIGIGGLIIRVIFIMFLIRAISGIKNLKKEQGNVHS
jgi:hypothetical protein